MKRFEWTLIQCWLMLLCAFLTGCAAVHQNFLVSPTSAPLAGQPGILDPSRQATASLQQLSLNLPAPGQRPTSDSTPEGSPFTGMSELSVDAFIEQALARNPSLAQMVAAWQAASARYPQVTSLDDPMFAGTVGPETIHPDDPGIEFASRFEISQKYPWPGKLNLRGANALAEANAAGNEVEDTRLRLIESAKDGFFEYYLVARALEVNKENLRLLRDFRENAATRFRTGLSPEQDVLQADVEIGRQQERQVTLERIRQVAIARINTLMNLSPEAFLPPPPKELTVGDALPDAQALRAAALANRPDLRAAAARIDAEEASLALANKEYYPDFEPFLMYDRFMGNTTASRDLATMLGVRLNLPVRIARRRGAASEAAARIAQRRAELADRVNQVSFAVQQAYEQVKESERNTRLYKDKILRDAEANVKAAQSAYVTGKNPFLSLIQAERDRVQLRDRYYEIVSDYFRRRAALERAVGTPLTPWPPVVPPQSPGLAPGTPCPPRQFP